MESVLAAFAPLITLVGGVLVTFIVMRRRRSEATGKVVPRTETDRLFEQGFERSRVGIAYLTSDGAWLHVNPRFLYLLGYERSELDRTNFRMLTHSDDRKREAGMMASLRSGRSRGFSMTKRLRRKDGSFKSFHCSTARLGGGSRTILQYVIDEAATGAGGVNDLEISPDTSLASSRDELERALEQARSLVREREHALSGMRQELSAQGSAHSAELSRLHEGHQRLLDRNRELTDRVRLLAAAVRKLRDQRLELEHRIESLQMNEAPAGSDASGESEISGNTVTESGELGAEHASGSGFASDDPSDEKGGVEDLSRGEDAGPAGTDLLVSITEPVYVSGSSRAAKYHRNGCSVISRLDPETLRSYPAAAEAEKDGLSACRRCA